METLMTIWEFFLNLDDKIEILVDNYGIYVYLVLFAIVFAETAFLILLFLPGDSLLFATCAFASVNNSLSFPVLFVLFYIAAILGDSCNFFIGSKFKNKFDKNKNDFFTKYPKIKKTSDFYERNGYLTIIVARFVPILRALAPFVAGITAKKYKWFLKNNVIGISIWSIFFCSLGYFFGHIPFVKNNFGLIVVGLTVVTLLTATISLLISRILMPKIKERR